MAACSGQKEEELPQEDLQDVIDMAEDLPLGDEEVHFANFTMQLPAGWTQEEPDNQMRVAQFGIDSNPDVKVVGFYFGGQAGTDEENIQRWRNEFTEIISTDDVMLADDRIKMVQIAGTFKLKPRPMAQDYTEAPDYITLAAIVPSDEGPFYFKLNGPADIINEESDDFVKFLESYELKQK